MTTTALLLALSLLQAEPATAAGSPTPPPASATESAADAAAPDDAAAPGPGATSAPDEAPGAESPAAPAAVAAEDDGSAAAPASTEPVAPSSGAATAEAPAPEPPAAAAAPEVPPLASPGPDAPPAAEAAVELAPPPPLPVEPLPPPPAPATVEGAPAPAPMADASEAVDAGGDALPRWGLTIDGGFPDAAGVAILWRPWRWLRLEAGGTTTVYASHGYRAGVSLVPFHFPLTPTLTVNYGRALEADWNPMLERFSEPDPDLEPVLREFGYQYVDAHLGLEIGSPRRFVLFVRAGLTQLWTTVHGLTPAAESALADADATVSDSHVTMRVPSVKVGVLFYVF